MAGLFETKKQEKPKSSASSYYLYEPGFIKQGQFTEEEYPIAEKIQRRRIQMLVHSRLYYELDINYITDYQFDAWGRELVELQTQYPEIACRICFADAFADWDASTGAFLPLQHPWVVYKAEQLIKINGGKPNEHQKIQQSSGRPSGKVSAGKKTSKQRGNSLF